MGKARQRRCLLIKAGRSTRGAGDRFCGWTDPPLSADGRQQILNLRQRLIESGSRLPRIWYVSDRRRAVETFEIMSAGLLAPVVRITEKLREINFGEFENLTWEELPDDFRRYYESSMSAPMDLKFPGGEQFSDMCDRVSGGALEILSYEEDDSDLGIVAHEGSFKVWQMMAEGLSPEAFFDDRMTPSDERWLAIDVAQVVQWRRKYLAPPGG